MAYKKLTLPTTKKRAKLLSFFQNILLGRLDDVRKELADLEDNTSYTDKKELERLQKREEDILIKLHKILLD